MCNKVMHNKKEKKTMEKLSTYEMTQVVGGNNCIKGVLASAAWGARHGWVGALIGGIGGYGKHCL